MHAEHQTEGELLAELRELHRSERATTALRERILAQLPRSKPTRAGSSRFFSFSAWPWLALPALALIAFAFWAKQRVQHSALASFATVAAEPHETPRVVPAPAPSQHCPLDDLQPGARYEPQFVEPFGAFPGKSDLELGTFAMPIPGCSPLVRRYLTYTPRGAPVQPDAPVLIVLHDSGDSAEAVRALQTQRTFEALADREGVIIVYANAGPGTQTGRFPNSGGWQTDPGANRAIDDEAYLAGVVEQLQKRGTITGKNAVFLVGYGGGGRLALEAGAEHPARYAGIAALLPSGVNRARPEEHLKGGSRVSRLLFIVTSTDHPDGYWPGKPLDIAVLEEWAVTIGLPRFMVAQRAGGGQHIDRTLEEPAAPAAPELALLPRGSVHFDFGGPESGAPRLRVLVVPHASDLEVGSGGTAPIDAAAQVWAFLEDAVR